MAVTKIRKVSSWTLLAVIIGLLAVLAAFLFGGENPPLNGKMLYPKNTDLLLYWMYAMFALTLVVALVFALMQFFRAFQRNAKKALGGLLVIIAFVAMLFVCYSMGDGAAIPQLAKDATATYNVAGWLKEADMMIYSIYVMFVLVILAIVWGAIRGLFRK
jgi:small-conductance mechanosensitive channel